MTRVIDYRYDECGIDNVILKDFRVVTDDLGEEVVMIPNVNMLHRVLMRLVASKESGLQPKEIRFLRTELGLTQAQLAELVGRDAQTIGRWERGENSLDQTAEMVIRKHALEHADGDDDLTMQELARRTTLTATQRPFMIDAHDPNDYKPLPVAA
jgi:DNA-binding transcriptional regulator YiaG